MNPFVHRVIWLTMGCCLLGTVQAEDWPSLRHDQRRSGVMSENLDVTRLVPKWKWRSPLPLAPAWPDAAKWDAYAMLEGSSRNRRPGLANTCHRPRCEQSPHTIFFNDGRVCSLAPSRGRPGEFRSHLMDADGIMFPNRDVRHGDVLDGTSHTILVGETLPDDLTNNGTGNELVGTKDHWAIGGDDPDVNKDWSEFLGSTAVPMNLFTQADVPDWLLALDARATAELSFASLHTGGAQFVRCDGSVFFLTESVDMELFKAMGTRAGGEILDDPQ